MTNERLVPVVNGPAPSTPLRKPFSIRRTSTIDTHWPQGHNTPMVQHGRGRDLLTLADVSAPTCLVEDCFSARLSSRREVLEIASKPARPGIAKLIGAKAGNEMRAAIADVLPNERASGTPLYLLLDDIAGSSLVAGWAWSQWLPEWGEKVMQGSALLERRQRMTGVCIGFAPGSSALVGGPSVTQQNARPVAPLDAGDDPQAWHELTPQEGPAARRARRIDVQLAETVLIDVHFQDSATTPSGPRMAVHEYCLTATADRNRMTLLSIEADPRILPFDECPRAILNLQRLVGSELGALRETVLSELKRTQGCTHLNDMVRSLAEVPQLASALAGATGQPPGPSA